jgi:hypothetical protein
MGRYYKILLISVGLLLGIILGGVIVYFILGGSVKNVYVFNQPAKNETEEKIENKKETNEKKEKSNPQVVIKYLKKEDNNKDDTDEKFTDKDSASIKINENTIQQTNNEDEDIIVKKDELLFSEMLMLIQLDTIKSNTGDSLAKAAANIKDPAINLFYQVEYWKSPLNYRGYKFGKNKLVIYGIEYIDKGNIYKWKEHFYFKANGRVYSLEKTAEFKPYEIANHPDLLKLIEKKSNAN